MGANGAHPARQALQHIWWETIDCGTPFANVAVPVAGIDRNLTLHDT
jgi:hypothetical protein